jgi:hypothetical protein
MNDDPLISAARRALDDSLHTLDAHHLSRLNQARHRALQRLEQPRSLLSWLGVPLAGRWLPGGVALASVALLTFALVQPATPPAPPELAQDSAGAFEALALHDDLELLHDLDFYEWLALQKRNS